MSEGGNVGKGAAGGRDTDEAVIGVAPPAAGSTSAATATPRQLTPGGWQLRKVRPIKLTRRVRRV